MSELRTWIRAEAELVGSGPFFAGSESEQKYHNYDIQYLHFVQYNIKIHYSFCQVCGSDSEQNRIQSDADLFGRILCHKSN